MRQNLLLEEEGKEVEKERGGEGEEQGRREGGGRGVLACIQLYTYVYNRGTSLGRHFPQVNTHRKTYKSCSSHDEV
jgi:hypothetical protein